jgi:prepilin-type N-terminal cleavage/methylation domain-containing protein
MKIFGQSKQSGFSLVELMIVVGIIGVLSTLALPRFKQFQSKAKMAEAMNVLQHVYTLEQSYSLDNNQYITMTAYGANTGTAAGQNQCTPDANAVLLGLVIEPCVAGAPTPRFSYSITGGGASFLAIAATGDAANNRICTGNGAFSVGLTQSNAPKWATGATPTNDGVAPVSSVCKS